MSPSRRCRVSAALVAAVLLTTGCPGGRPVNCSFMTPAQRQKVRDRGDYCSTVHYVPTHTQPAKEGARKTARPRKAPREAGDERLPSHL